MPVFGLIRHTGMEEGADIILNPEKDERLKVHY